MPKTPIRFTDTITIPVEASTLEELKEDFAGDEDYASLSALARDRLLAGMRAARRRRRRPKVDEVKP